MNNENINLKSEENKKQFRIFGPVSIIYSLVFVFCLYKNLYGITSPIWAIATVAYIVYIAKKFEKKWRFINTFISIAIVLLGFSNFITANTLIIFFNYIGIVLLIIVNMVYLFVNIKGVSILRHLEMLIMIVGGMIGRICEPFEDIFEYAKERKPKNSKKLLQIIIGLAIAVPLVIILICILASADVIFDNMINDAIELLRLENIINNFIGLTAMLLIGYMVPYAFSKHICNSNTEVKEGNLLSAKPIIPTIVTAAIAFVYGIFSVVQIVYLFMGKGELPEGYSYAEYAREGFFQLLAVSIFNILIILVCIELFKEKKRLKVILTIISVCTFIMIASSAYRMSMYIDEYGLTITRVFVLWALVVISLIMLGFLCKIYIQKIDMFKYGMVVVALCFVVLSLSRIDYHIAKYNLNIYKEMNSVYKDDFFSSYVDYRYIYNLSADAAPIVLEHKDEIDKHMDKYKYEIKEPKWYREKYKGYLTHYNLVTIRKVNLSNHIARLSLEKYMK